MPYHIKSFAKNWIFVLNTFHSFLMYFIWFQVSDTTHSFAQICVTVDRQWLPIHCYAKRRQVEQWLLRAIVCASCPPPSSIPNEAPQHPRSSLAAYPPVKKMAQWLPSLWACFLANSHVISRGHERNVSRHIGKLQKPLVVKMVDSSQTKCM